MYSTSDFKKNLKIEIDGEPFVIVDCNHVKPGKGNAFVKTKYKSLITGLLHQNNFRSGDKVQKPDLESREMQYLYPEGDFYVFMDNNTYDQKHITKANMEDVLDFLKDNLMVEVLFHNDKPISIELPNFLEIEVSQTDPGLRGDTASGGTKPATLETGAVINVPLYIKTGEVIKVDTRTRTFVERVKN